MTKLLVKQIDKANHFIVGTLVFCAATLFLNPLLSLLLVTLIGVGKEVRDYLTYKVFDIKDLLYTIAGALPVLITTIIK
jgi:hypothetical protein